LGEDVRTPGGKKINLFVQGGKDTMGRKEYKLREKKEEAQIEFCRGWKVPQGHGRKRKRHNEAGI